MWTTYRPPRGRPKAESPLSSGMQILDSALSPVVPKGTAAPVISSLGELRHAHRTRLITQKCSPLQRIFLPLEEGMCQFPENFLPSKMEKLQ